MFKCLVTARSKAGKCMLPSVRDTLALELLSKIVKIELGRGFDKIFFLHMSSYFSSFTNVCVICSKYTGQYLYKQISLIQ